MWLIVVTVETVYEFYPGVHINDELVITAFLWNCQTLNLNYLLKNVFFYLLYIPLYIFAT